MMQVIVLILALIGMVLLGMHITHTYKRIEKLFESQQYSAIIVGALGKDGKVLNLRKTDLTGLDWSLLTDEARKALESVERVDISRSTIRDLSTFAPLHLKQLVATRSSVEDLSKLHGSALMESLEKLYVDRTRVEDLRGLERSDLKYLDISRTAVESLEPVSKAKISIINAMRTNLTTANIERYQPSGSVVLFSNAPLWRRLLRLDGDPTMITAGAAVSGSGRAELTESS